MTAPGGVGRWVLRPDLDIVQAESVAGRPAFLVHDPVSGSFDRVEWPESDIILLLRQPKSLPELLLSFAQVNPLRPSVEDMQSYLGELGRRGWLQGSRFWPRAYKEKPRGGVMRLLARSLFIQIPLLHPEKFLRATSFLARLVVNQFTFFAVLLCGLAGLYLTLPRWEDYWRDSFGSFSLARIPAFVVAVIIVKTIHEFAHAYVATLAGARVATMGVAFFFFMPLPYTDVTDAWRLPWRKRLAVAAAGMAAEAGLAGISLLLWSLSPPGTVAMALARLSSLAIASTLLTNLNPGPRFDGYYVLVCLFRMENLRPRSMAMLRNAVWGRLFGKKAEHPDGDLGRRRRLAMIAYALYAIFYRISLGIGLALMAYYVLPRALGLPAAAFGLWLFIAYPALIEVVRFWRHGAKMRLTISLVVTIFLLGAAFVWFVGSWPRRMHFPAVTRIEAEDAVRTQRSGTIAQILVERGQRVAANEVVARLESEADSSHRRRAEWALLEAEKAEEQAWRGEKSRREAATRAAEIERRRSELEVLDQQAKYLEVLAPVDGTLEIWDQDLKPGDSVGRGKVLGWITDGRVETVACYPDIETARRLDVGAEVRFFPDDGGGFVVGRVVRIEQSRPEVLEDVPLAQALGAVSRQGAWVLPTPYARVTVRLEENMPRAGQTGVVWTWSRPESLLDLTIEWLRGLALRESSF